MNGKTKKNKSKLRSSDDLTEIKLDKKVGFKDNNIIDDTKITKDLKIPTTRKRHHTKVSRKSKNNNSNLEILDPQIEKGRKVKFGKIKIIDVESWKEINLKLTAEENFDELMKLSQGKKGKIKNVNCTCIII